MEITKTTFDEGVRFVFKKKKIYRLKDANQINHHIRFTLDLQ